MDDSSIRRIVQEEIRKSGTKSRFGLQSTNYHTHNSTDSAQIFQPIVTYIGLIGATGTAGILPSGWSIAYAPTGIYQIQHNLNSFQYSVVASPVGTTGIVDINLDANIVEFDWFTPASVAQDTPFFFNIVIVNNKKLNLPVYQPTVWTQTGVLT